MVNKLQIRFLSRSSAWFLMIMLCLQMLPTNILAQRSFDKKSDEIQPTSKDENEDSLTKRSKVSPDLEEKVNEVMFAGEADSMQKVIIQLKPETPLNAMLGNSMSESETKQMFAQEVQSNKTKSGILISDLARVGGRMNKSFNNIGLVSAELPLLQVKELIKSNTVEYVSLDGNIQSFGHIGNATGWTNTGIYDNGDSDPNTWLTGNYGHIVVIDSGIDTNHSLMRWMNTGGQSKVKHSRDFTGQGITGDPYGHGTHVASMFGGDWVLGGAAYEGVADGASVINLRVLNSIGVGSVSNLIAALDWTVANKTVWNIRVINMSLGTAAKDSYKNDPLCLAARRAVNAGIVVVASAGNFGKDSLGNKLYGTIGSPGIEPSVITVGAADTKGTDYRSDDTVASFSSRGPTRGYVTLSNGARKYDNLIKPDLVAPGNKLIGARAYYNGTENLLSRTFTTLRTGTDNGRTNDLVMYLSGTSMAAPVVAGAAMNLVQVNPNLTPNLIKAILMYSAQPLPNANSLEQGAGELNIDAAVRIARLVKTTMPTSNGTALLTSSLPTSQTSVIGGQTVYWGKGVITNFGFLYGNDLMNKWQGMYANGVLMSDSTPFSGSTISRSTTLTNGTLSLYQGAIRNNGVLMSDGTNYLTANAMGSSPTPFVNSQGVLMSDGVLLSDGVLMSDGVLLSDNITIATQAMLGDNTSCMQPAP